MGEVALNSLIVLLNSSNPDHRWWAVRSLSKFQDPNASEALQRSLSDSDASVRHCAAMGLRHIPHPDAIPALVQALGSKDRFFARLAGDALTALGERAIPALAEALQSSNPATRGEAARSLAKMKNPETLPILYSAIEDPSSIVQHWVDEGFNLLGVGMVFFKP